jgi:hypothetical protein
MTAQEAVAFLASKRRTVLLGGMAMILHGLSRNTKDYDIWLDPLPDAQTWGKPNTRATSRKVGTVRCAKWDYCEIRHR